jgi:non-specific serine/threonine protein kinase/serine/threonine-protein kinase
MTQYWQEVEEIFAATCDADDRTRAAILDARCAGRADLRADVESLLAAHARTDDLAAPPAVQAFISPWLQRHAAGRPLAASRSDTGRRIGNFRLVELLAQGGMGDVYRAERVDSDFTQQVAIKLLAARLPGANAARRFRIEQQILATLSHPHIVKFLDGGVTDEGQPFIVMELVRGVPITEYCRRHALALLERVRLFQQVASAVQWAHRHLIVHRDLKPENVLVNDDGRVTVLDFGVAKLLDTHARAAHMTASLVAPMTPNYASPEQIRGLPATTACDVYAMGVMLHELLAGRRPYETSDRNMDEIRAIVLDRRPGRPSEVAPGAVPYDPRRLRGDVDAIVMKALATEPADRYTSAEDLSDDLQRLLDRRPVTARTPSIAYVARRTIARHRAAFTTTAIAAVLLVSALVAALWQATVAAAERERAMQRYNDVRELAGALIFRIHDDVAPLPGSTPVRKTIVAEGLKFLERLEDEAGDDEQLRVELSEAYVRIGHVQGRLGEANLGDVPGAVASYRKASGLVAPLVAGTPRTWNAVGAAVGARLALAGVLPKPQAIEEARAAVALATTWAERDPESRSQTLLARAHFQMALLTAHAQALGHWQQADRLFSAVLASDSANPVKLRNVALARKYLGAYYENARQLDTALAYYRAAQELDAQRLAASPDDRQARLDYAIDVGNVANVQLLRGEFAASVHAYGESLRIRERIAADDPKDVYAQSRVGFALTKLATLHLRLEELAAARDYADRALRILDPLAAANRAYARQLFGALKTMADIEWVGGRRAAACTTFRRAQALAADDDSSPAAAEIRRDLEQSLGRCAAR